jgi:transposase-like protein
MGRNGSRSYTRQFREQAMDLVRVQGLDPTHAARELGMPFSTLHLWLRKAGWVKRADGPAAAAPLPEDPAALKVRVAELERQVKRLELEREILKKATAFFAGQSP